MTDNSFDKTECNSNASNKHLLILMIARVWCTMPTLRKGGAKIVPFIL